MSDIIKTTSIIAQIGNLMCDTKKEKNSWKERMFRATGLLDFPDDWKELSEDEKEKRLNKIIEISKEEL